MRLKSQGFRKKKCGKKRSEIDEHIVQANQVSVISESVIRKIQIIRDKSSFLLFM